MTKILIVDDDREILQSMSLILGDFGYEVHAVEDFEKVEDITWPDVIILDLWMPRKSGEDICNMLKSNEETQHIPVIIASAKQDVREVADTCKADSSLQKPFDIYALTEKIEDVLERSL